MENQQISLGNESGSDAVRTYLAREYYHFPRRRTQLLKVMAFLEAAMATGEPVEVYAMTRTHEFYYKVSFCTPYGVLRSGAGDHLVTKSVALRVIQHARLERISLDALLLNGVIFGVHAHRVIGSYLLRRWQHMQCDKGRALNCSESP